MPDAPKKPKRIALTPTQAATPEGIELTNLVRKYLSKGILSNGDAKELRAEALSLSLRADFAATSFIAEEVGKYLKRNKRDYDASWRFHDSLRRLVPKSERDEFKAIFDRSKDSLPATEKQVAYLRDLGVKDLDGITRGEAGAELDYRQWKRDYGVYEGGPGATSRQRCILKFFGTPNYSRMSKFAAGDQIEAILENFGRIGAAEESDIPLGHGAESCLESTGKEIDFSPRKTGRRQRVSDSDEAGGCFPAWFLLLFWGSIAALILWAAFFAS